MSAQALAEKASQHSIKITPITSSTDSKKPEFLLSFAGIAKEDIAPGIEALKKPLKTVKSWHTKLRARDFLTVFNKKFHKAAALDKA